MRKKFFLIAGLIFIVFLSAVSATPTTVKIEPETIQVEEGEEFTLSFIVKPSEIVNTIAIDELSWFPDIIDCIAVERGSIFEDATIWIDGKEKNADNVKFIVWGSQIETQNEGIFVTMKFKATASGSCSINIDKFGVAYAGNDLEKQILNSCSVSVGSGQPMVAVPNGISIYLIISIIIIISFVIIAILIKKRGRMGIFPKKD